jgi:hypothetical protein
MANGLYAAIAEGGKPIQLENPLNQMARLAALRGAEQEQQLNAMRLREAETGARESEALRNYLSGVSDVSSPEARARLMTGFGKAGLGYVKQLGEVEKGNLEAQTKRFDLIKNKTNYYRDALATVNTPEDAQIWTAAVFNDPVVGPTVANLGGNLEQALARVPRDPAQFAQWRQETALGAQKFIELNAPRTSVVDRGGQRDVIQTPGLGGPPTTVGTYSDVPLPPDVAAQRATIARAGRPTTTVVMPEQEKAERKARGELLVNQYKTVSDAARLAGRSLPALETQEKVLDAGFKTGFGTEAKKAAASVLSALGVPEAEKVATDGQRFLAASQQAVLQRQLEQKGPQTEADAQRITQTGAQLGNTVNANRFIISVAKAQLKRDVAQRNFYDSWWKQNKTYDGAEDAWFSGEGGKSLFESPELKQYVTPAAPSQPREDGARGGAPVAGASSVREQADAILKRK